MVGDRFEHTIDLGSVAWVHADLEGSLEIGGGEIILPQCVTHEPSVKEDLSIEWVVPDERSDLFDSLRDPVPSLGPQSCPEKMS